MLWLLALAMAGSLGLVLAGVMPGRAEGFYLLSLMLGLGAACTMFILVIGSILMPLQSDERQGVDV